MITEATTKTLPEIEFVEHEGYVYLLVDGATFKGCRRCGGEGYYSFNGEHGRCYDCDAKFSGKLGESLGTVADAEKWCHKKALARAARIRKEERLLAARQAALAAKVETVRAKDAGVVEFLLSIDLSEGTNGERSSFILKMAEALQYPAQADWKFTDAMIAGVRKTLDARSTKEASKVPVVEGRVVITGKVVSTKSYETDYGTSYKMLVEDERGFRVFGSIPSNIWDEVAFLGSYRKNVWGEGEGVMTKLVGMELSFTATVEASNDDKAFGFFKRPTKATIAE